MKSNVDYGWAVFLGIAVLAAVLWKPMSAGIGNLRGKMTNKEGYDRGQAIFYDSTRWGPDNYVACAMCHITDFQFDAGKEVTMQDFVKGEFHVLEGMQQKYYTGMGDDTEMVKAINKCLSMPSRMNQGGHSIQAPWMQDLLTYVKRQ
jgi:hypothetical protein